MSIGLVLWGVKSIFTVFDRDSGKEYICKIKGKVLTNNFDKLREKSPIVAGDFVNFSIINDNEGLIIGRIPRKNEFFRLKKNGREIQTLAANVDKLIIVNAVTKPDYNIYFIDRFLFFAELSGIEPIIVFNKIDLLDNQINSSYQSTKNIYKKLGYKIIETSTINKQGIDILKKTFKNKISSLIGNSGVGKSALVKTIQPKFKNIRIGQISEKENVGKHTTSFSKIYRVFDNSFIIDTPGIRTISFYVDELNEVQGYFPDFDNYRENCKYPNCQHSQEPNCAVKEAVLVDKIEKSRYESYLKILSSLKRLRDRIPNKLL